MSGLGAFGAPQLGAENVGGMVAPFKGNLLTELITALGQFPEMQRKAQQERLGLQQQEIQNKYLPQQIEAQTQEQQAYAQQVKLQSENAMRAAAAQRWAQLGQFALANPAWANSPQFKQSLTETAQALGVPPPLKPDGSVDTDVWKTPLSQIVLKDKDFVQKGLQIPPGKAREAYFSQVSMPPDQLAQLLTADQVIAPKDLAAFERDRVLGIHYQNMDAAARERADSTKLITQYREGLITAQTKKAYADMQTSAIRANAEMERAQADMIRALKAGARARSSASRRPSATIGQQISKTQFNEAEREMRSAQRSYAGAQAAYKAAVKAGAGDDVLQPLQTKMQQMYGQMQQAQQGLQDAQQMLQSNYGAAADIRAITGKPATVENAGQQPAKNVMHSRSRSGKPIYSTDGGKTWLYGNP